MRHREALELISDPRRGIPLLIGIILSLLAADKCNHAPKHRLEELPDECGFRDPLALGALGGGRSVRYELGD
jgi:hypothetical protein